jgi:hypothetical protein
MASAVRQRYSPPVPDITFRRFMHLPLFSCMPNGRLRHAMPLMAKHVVFMTIGACHVFTQMLF